MSNILVFAAHPDDEILGVGGTIAKRVKNGDIAYAVILGEGQTSRWNNRESADMNAVENLHEDTLEAAKEVGYKSVFFENLPDNRFDQVDLLDVVKIIEKYVERIKPDVIYTHHHGDLNVDHQVTYNAVLTGTRPIHEDAVKEIYTFETLSSTEWNFTYKEQSFCPNVFVDISDELQEKKNAMHCYRSELCQFPHPRSIEGIDSLARIRGTIVGCAAAEAFYLVRKVDR